MRFGFTPRSFRRPRWVNIALGLTAATLVFMVASLVPDATKARQEMTLALFIASLGAWVMAAGETVLRRRQRRKKPNSG